MGRGPVPDGNGGSLLTSRVDLNVKGTMRLAQPVLARFLRRHVRRDDETLKTVLEQAP